MDGLSALGVAASVVQFLQFSGSLVSKSRQFYTQGALLKDVECEHASKRLGELTGQIRASLKNLETSGSLSSDAQALETICGNCMNLSAELLARLNELRVDENYKRKKWKSFRQALKSLCSKDVVDGIAKRLADCRDELHTHVLVSIKYDTFLYL
jgi:hypothetical protein